MTKLIRVLIATAVLPSAVLAVVAVLVNAWRDRLPDPVATHWNGGPDNANSLGLFVTVCLVLGAAVTAFVVVVAVLALRRGRPLPRLTIGMGAGLAAMPAAVLLSTLLLNLDVPDWHQARGGAVVLLFLLGAAVLGVLAAFVGGLPSPPREHRTDPNRPSIGLRPGQRAFWSGRAANPAMLWTLLLVPGAIVLLSAGIPWPTAVWIALVGIAVTAVSYRLRATVGTTGVTIRFGLFGFPWRHIGLSDIREATVRELTTFGDGGLGLRVNSVTGTTAYKVRGGPALALTLESGRTILVSVDDPETGAGLVNDLIAQGVTRID
jgi:MFS family permease